MITLAITGAVAGLALIVAIGAQNAFVLRQGLRREHVGPVIAVCAISDAVLILVGISGIGALVDRAPTALEVVRWLGVAFLIWYGVRALRRAAEPASLDASGGAPATRRSILLQAFALTWLNPHVYLDTVLLLGSLANQHGQAGRWWFGAGAMTASLGWFVSLGIGAKAASRWFSSARAWQVIDIVVALTMFAVATMLALA